MTSQPNDHHSADNEHPNDVGRAMRLLAKGAINELHGVMRWGSNYAALVTVTDLDSDPPLTATAVYKPRRGERPLWDFPDGTLCQREVAAYHISQALEWQFVPPTVLRDGPHGIGSLQLFIEHDPQINYFNLEDRFVIRLRQVAAFDYVINNADRKGGHLLRDAQDRLWSIDHGLSFHPVPKLRTVIWEFAGEQVAPALLAPVRTLCHQLETAGSDLRQQLAALLTPTEIDALLRRIANLLETRQYPKPGPGPNHPWPPV